MQYPSDVGWLRSASSGKSDAEASCVRGRKSKILPGLRSYLSGLHLADFDVDCYVGAIKKDRSKVPTVGVAISGGAWAAALTGTGLLRALHGRFQPAAEQ